MIYNVPSKNIAALVGLITLLGLNLPTAFADNSLSFSPTSPQAYGLATDPEITCGLTGNFAWAAFNDSGAKLGNGLLLDAGYGGSHADDCSGGLFSEEFTTDLDTYNGHSGDITFIYYDINQSPDPTDECQLSSSASLSSCLSVTGATGAAVRTFTLTEEEPPPEETATSTASTTTDLSNLNLLGAFFLFLYSMFGVITILKPATMR